MLTKRSFELDLPHLLPANNKPKATKASSGIILGIVLNTLIILYLQKDIALMNTVKDTVDLPKADQICLTNMPSI
ncbi:Uncharacterised protein [Chlamydia trachomatis]|nr:Uncharacterised protein [Chlamydia trachomatis]